ncbi:MAG: helix-turn-helix domain-containing protein [Chlamydiales bacterium]|nr:helix-turn-helix domain-containing protein [Chlamydiales bacterium]
MKIREELTQIGELFKQRRKELNLSLKEIENATSIRMTYLQAIEDGEIHKLNSPVYAQGFVRQYASFLGIDGEKIVRDNPEVFLRPEAQEFAYGIGTLEVRGNPGAGVKWFPNAIWISAFVLLIITAWFTARYFGVL